MTVAEAVPSSTPPEGAFTLTLYVPVHAFLAMVSGTLTAYLWPAASLTVYEPICEFLQGLLTKKFKVNVFVEAELF